MNDAQGKGAQGAGGELAGFLPYLPFPAKLHTTVLPAMTSTSTESAADFAERVEAAMQEPLIRDQGS